MREQYFISTFVFACLSSSSQSEHTKLVADTPITTAVTIEQPLSYQMSISAARVDLNAYYFFIPNDSSDSSCSFAVTDALSSLSLENRIGAVYFFEYYHSEYLSSYILPSQYASVAAVNPELQFFSWLDDLKPGLNGTVYNHNNSPTESVFFNPLGNATRARESWTNKGYAVVAPLDLFASFIPFADSKKARPMIDVYTCSVNYDNINNITIK